MSLVVIKAGIQDSIQDYGRFGQQQFGINPGGAMDKYAMQLTNILLGNEPGTSVIELQFPASVFLFQESAMIALGGADFSASINGEPVPQLHPIIVCKNDVLQFHKPVHGARAYLAISGGIVAPQWLKSSSTNFKVRKGGHQGRAFQKNDEIVIAAPAKGIAKNCFSVLHWQAEPEFLPPGQNTHPEKNEVWILPGNEFERLGSAAGEKFFSTDFLITPQSDRMGYRLESNALPIPPGEELVSAAVSFGTIQLLPAGQLIVLMADHQTTGGYPRIGHVITAHHSRLAQSRPGDRIRFVLTDQEKAEALLVQQQQYLQQLRNACTFRLEEYFQNEHR